MKSIYCISGFGADERVFAHLNFGNHDVHFIQWKIPENNESITHYAQRMASEIRDTYPILIGLSFGGMMSIEVAKIISTEKVILISSIKNYHEKPWYMRLTAYSRINKVVPIRPYSFLAPLENYQLSVRTEEERKLVEQYRKNISPIYADWAINEIIHWKNEWQPSSLFHIHGDSDHIFPIKKLHPDFIIKGGGHMMLMNQSEEVNLALRAIL
jgi:pimeloyl-ACP methyl ester carboxylesterase